MFLTKILCLFLVQVFVSLPIFTIVLYFFNYTIKGTMYYGHLRRIIVSNEYIFWICHSFSNIVMVKIDWYTSHEGNLAKSINILTIYTIFDLEIPGLRNFLYSHRYILILTYKLHQYKIIHTSTMQNIQQYKTG